MPQEPFWSLPHKSVVGQLVLAPRADASREGGQRIVLRVLPCDERETHQFSYMVCTTTIPAGLSQSDITNSAASWGSAVRWPDYTQAANDGNIIGVSRLPDADCADLPSRGPPPGQIRNQFMFVSKEERVIQVLGAGQRHPWQLIPLLLSPTHGRAAGGYAAKPSERPVRRP